MNRLELRTEWCSSFVVVSKQDEIQAALQLGQRSNLHVLPRVSV